jgi:hypothetical protein
MAKEKRISITEAKNLLDNLNDRIVQLRYIGSRDISELILECLNLSFLSQMLNKIIYKAEISGDSFISNNSSTSDLINIAQGATAPELVTTSGAGAKFFDADMKGDI